MCRSRGRIWCGFESFLPLSAPFVAIISEQWDVKADKKWFYIDVKPEQWDVKVAARGHETMRIKYQQL